MNRTQSKGKVERPIRYLRERVFYGRAFEDDKDVNAQAARWLEGGAKLSPRTTGRPPFA